MRVLIDLSYVTSPALNSMYDVTFSDDKPNLVEANQNHSSESSRDQRGTKLNDTNFRKGLPARELQNKDRASIFLVQSWSRFGALGQLIMKDISISGKIRLVP